MEYFVGSVDDLPPGGRKLVATERTSICIFNVNGRFYGLSNTCAHHGAPLCAGQVTGTTLPSRAGEIIWGHEGEIIRCPWHGWEYDIKTGRTIFDNRPRLKTYEVVVRDGFVYLQLGD